MNVYRLQRYTQTHEENSIVVAKNEKDAVSVIANKTSTSENDWEVCGTYDSTKAGWMMSWKRNL
jgi:hypothetical protein